MAGGGCKSQVSKGIEVSQGKWVFQGQGIQKAGPGQGECRGEENGGIPWGRSVSRIGVAPGRGLLGVSD